jgi:hypothetical protein
MSVCSYFVHRGKLENSLHKSQEPLLHSYDILLFHASPLVSRPTSLETRSVKVFVLRKGSFHLSRKLSSASVRWLVQVLFGHHVTNVVMGIANLCHHRCTINEMQRLVELLSKDTLEKIAPPDITNPSIH